MLKDHPSTTLRTSLGPASVVTDSSGNIVGEQRYYPFGETRLSAGTLYTDKLFTGQRNITGLGIYHYQSRFYSPKLGRFLSADTIVPNPFNPQDYSRYSYVMNNPVKYTDPSGHRACVTQEECADMGTTPNGGTPSKPRHQLCTRNCGGVDKPEGNGGDDEVNIAGILGLNQGSDLACTVNSCMVDSPPGICPIGETCSIGSFPGFWINWSVAATFTQDLATGIDFVFAGTEIALIGVGCSLGPEGCGAGWAAGMTLFNISGANAAESYLSGVSLAFTVADDFSKTGWFGDASFTSAVTFLIGGINPDPIADLAIDGYASGYNHGVFNDLNTIFFGSPLIKP